MGIVERRKSHKRRKEMRMTKASDPYLYDAFIKQRGGTVVFQGTPWTPPMRGGFGFSLGPLSSFGSAIKSLVPKIGKRFIKELGPKLATAATKTAGELISNRLRNPRKTLMRNVQQNRKLLTEGRKILGDETGKLIAGSGKVRKKGGRKRRQIHYRVGKKTKGNIFDTI